MNIENIDMRLLKAVAMFAAKDPARPVLETVRVADDLFVATNTHLLAMGFAGDASPAKVLQRVKDSSGEDAPLVPATLIEQAAKRGGANVNGSWSLEVTDSREVTFAYAGPTSGSDGGWTVDGAFPNFGNLVAPDEPPAVANVAFGAQYVERMAKAAKIVAPYAPLIFHGALGSVKPAYWSVGDSSRRLVILAMPVRVAGEVWA